MNSITRKIVATGSLSFVAVLGMGAPGRSLEAQAGDEPIVVTHHRITLDGRTLEYTARAGRIPIRDNAAGDIHGQMFFVSYTLDGADRAAPRPITFAWNGGPGSNAALVHLIGFGPKRLAPPAGARADDAVRWVVEENPGTWLDATDLVFVDPIGTGYSRVTRPEYAPEFYQTKGDAESVAEFIRVYRTRYGTEDAPLFLAGESYGVTRAANVAEALEGRGTAVRGVVLLGLEPPLGALTAERRNALALPNYTVAAFTHQKLAPDLQHELQSTLRQAEAWAGTGYAIALAHVGTLSAAERDSVVRMLSRFSGMGPSAIDRKTLVLDRMQVANSLLGREGRFVGLYDIRQTAPLDAMRGPYDPRKDPSLTHLLDPVAVLRYLRGELGYQNDLNYQGPWGGAYPPPAKFRGDWMSVRWNWAADSAFAKATPPLETAMTTDPALRVFVGCGIYDLICSYFANERKMAELPAGLRQRVTVKAYPGGHALYTDDAARLQLRADVVQFIRQALRR